jgi:hypothetical protein
MCGEGYEGVGKRWWCGFGACHFFVSLVGVLRDLGCWVCAT